MLEFDDIQHILLTRAPALTGRYEFLSFRNAAGGRAWLSAILEKVQSAAEMRASVDKDNRWVTRGLHLERPARTRCGRGFAGHVSRRVQARHGRPRGDARRHRTRTIRITGWAASPARTFTPSRSCLPATPPSASAARPSTTSSSRGAKAWRCSRRWTWRRRRRSTMRTTISATATGSRSRSWKAPARCRRPAPARRSSRANSSSATRTKTDRPANLPQPEILSRNGSYMAYRRLQEHVGRFRDFLREHGKTPEEQELIAAKLMGRWRSGAPLVLAPDKDDPALGADPQRNNDFNYKQMDPHGYAVPLGSHMRRMNPRDTAAEHEPPPHDPPRRHLWPASAGEMRRRTAWSAASPRS